MRLFGNVVSERHKWFVCARVFQPRRIEEPKVVSKDRLMAFQLATAFGIEFVISKRPNLLDEATSNCGISQPPERAVRVSVPLPPDVAAPIAVMDLNGHP
jgi:hypothetical protein